MGVAESGLQISFGYLASDAGGGRATLTSDYVELLYVGEGNWKVTLAIVNL